MWQESKEERCPYAWNTTRMAESLLKYLPMVDLGATLISKRYDILSA